MVKSKGVLIFCFCLSMILVQVSLCEGQARVVGGSPSVIDRLPFLVQIFNNGGFHCGGTLVADQYVVTACHCTKNIPKQSLIVKAGATHLSENGVTSLVSQKMEPSNFNQRTLDFDVAVLKLATPLRGPSIRPIPLSTREVRHGDSAQIMGWGNKKDYTDYTSVQLFTANVNIFDLNTCRQMYANILPITENMICAHAPGKSTCNGDSGGPMIVGGEFVGIVSFGIDCGVGNNLPAVFGKVSKFIPFIRQSMNM